MKIRSVTCFANLDETLNDDAIEGAGRLAAEARESFARAGLMMQVTRFATQPVNEIIRDPAKLLPFALELERACDRKDLEFKGLGAVEAAARGADLRLISEFGQIINATKNVFAAVQISTCTEGVNLRAVHATARLIRALADEVPKGMGNFRFAALANCRPCAPFFPAAFADDHPRSFSIATEAADLAVRAFSTADTLERAREELVRSIERAADVIVKVARALEEQFGWRFNGIDFTLAPNVDIEESIGTALERLTGNAFGERTMLFATTFLTDCIRRANFPRTGFSGVFLPVLEDGTIAARTRTNNFSIDSLLLYSSVCGTGLDNIPLPGDVSADELAAILLDLATLAVRLDKPLTARLLPIPEGREGELTEFDFEWFTNGRIMGTRGAVSQKWADTNEWIGFQ